ncbi:MAG: hypothetical protein QM741_12210 [Rudaea sp.]|uniref:hypothetical protein n=1 Tax=Rudaea sp. TaxID=2136325 RepID=UPI0039E240F5
MKLRLLLSCLLLAAPLAVPADDNPLTEAARLGLLQRAQQLPTGHGVTPAEWRRRQLAAADKSERIMRRAQEQPGLLAQYLAMRAAYDGSDERMFRLVFSQYLSWFQTWIGDYDGAERSFSIAQPAQPDDAASPLAGAWRTRAADEAILELAKNRKAVFFNEAHSAPLTRTLTAELLARLRAQGYTHFAAETLYLEQAEALRKRGYPVSKSGFYTEEPIYAEMVRAAQRLGYIVVAYDAEEAGTGDARERASAQALYDQVFGSNPDARLVVNAGFGHIQKSGAYLGGSSMAKFFAKIANVDPLCVEQTMMIPHVRSDQDHPWYTAAMQAAHPAQPFVYVDAAGKPWTLKPGLYDVSVFFPPTAQIDGRPDWVSLGGIRQPHTVGGDLCRNRFPCLIEARYANEGDDAVAADRTVLDAIDPSAPTTQHAPADHGSAQSRLYLYPGDYRLSAIDGRGRVVSSQSATIAPGTAAP